MFTQLGDTLALQYGGSETNKRVATEADQVCISNIPSSRRKLSVRLVCVYLGAGRGKGRHSSLQPFRVVIVLLALHISYCGWCSLPILHCAGGRCGAELQAQRAADHHAALLQQRLHRRAQAGRHEPLPRYLPSSSLLLIQDIAIQVCGDVGLVIFCVGRSTPPPSPTVLLSEWLTSCLLLGCLWCRSVCAVGAGGGAVGAGE